MAVSTALDAIRLGSSEVAALYLGSDSVWTANAPGMVLLTDYTITHAGTSATLTNGQVTFTAVTSLSLNGCFTADFDNYVVSVRGTSSTNTNLYYRLRASGSDASGSNYTVQELVAESTAVSAARYTSQTQANNFLFGPSLQNGDGLYFYGPFLAQPTASRVVSVGESGGARIIEYAVTHSLSTSYDGFTFLTNSAATVTGALQVYGVRS